MKTWPCLLCMITSRTFYAPWQETSYLFLWFTSLIKRHMKVVVLCAVIVFILPFKKKNWNHCTLFFWKTTSGKNKVINALWHTKFNLQQNDKIFNHCSTPAERCQAKLPFHWGDAAVNIHHSWGSRLKMTLMHILQHCGNGPHVHLNAAGPVFNIPNFLFRTRKKTN